jgi:protein-disulfide isomerase
MSVTNDSATKGTSSWLAALPTFKGAAIAVPLLFGLAGMLTVASRPAPATTTGGQKPVQLAQAKAPAAAAAPTGPSSFSPAQRSEIEGIIKSYLTQNPDVLIEVTKELEKRQAAMQAEEHKKVILEKKASIFKAPTDFVWGNPKGNVTVVEFFDYNCGWCKKAVDELTKLTKADPNVRVVFKELPIFGENSVNASKAAMASVRQGKYFEYHVALMKEKQVTKDNLFKIAEKVGLNVDKLKADMADPAIEAALKENGVIAAALGIEGTPGFIVDTKVNVGFIPAEGGNSITSLIGEVRKAGCQVC